MGESPGQPAQGVVELAGPLVRDTDVVDGHTGVGRLAGLDEQRQGPLVRLPCLLVPAQLTQGAAGVVARDRLDRHLTRPARSVDHAVQAGPRCTTRAAQWPWFTCRGERPMMYYGPGMGAWGYLLMTANMLLFWGLLIAGVVFLVRYLGRP